MNLEFPAPFKHDHKIRDVSELFQEQLTPGQRFADWVARTVGTWQFIICQSAILVVWVLLNVVAWVNHWDPYPFILLNLVFSVEAAYTAPVILMSQNRQDERDRLEARHDYEVNQKAETEIRAIMDSLAAHQVALTKIYEAIQKKI